MSITVSGTTVTFNDGTTQTTSAQGVLTYGAVGSYTIGCSITAYNAPASGTYYAVPAGTTISGSNIYWPRKTASGGYEPVSEINISDPVSSVSSGLSGTWIARGASYAYYYADYNQRTCGSTVWQRIS